MQCTLSRLHESVVLGYEDLSTFSLSWMVYDGQISPTNHPFVTSNVVAILDSISTRFIGAQCRWNSVAPNMAFLFLSYFATSKKQTSCQSALQPSPRSFRICVCSAGAGVGCFPQGLHMLATDVCLSAIMSLFECSERWSGSICNSIGGSFQHYWFSALSCPCWLCWLGQLMQQSGICTVIMSLWATHHLTIVTDYDLYLSHVAESLKQADKKDKPFGNLPPVLNPILPVLCPPCPKNWNESKFCLQAYADRPTCAPPPQSKSLADPTFGNRWRVWGAAGSAQSIAWFGLSSALHAAAVAGWLFCSYKH